MRDTTEIPDVWQRSLAHPWLSGAEYHSSLDSTNAHGLRRLKSLPESLPACPWPYLILAEEQESGRGRGSHMWYSTQGALTFSLLWEMPPVREGSAPLSLLVGAVVCEALEPLCGCDPVRLKWPNDVYIRQRKIAGILIEAPGDPKGMHVIGIGVNVNNSFDNAPQEVQSRAISLQAVAANACHPSDVLSAILDRMNDVFDRQCFPSWSESMPWERFCLLRGKSVRLQTASGDIIGICRGTQSNGALLVADANQRTHAVHSGEVIAFDCG
ncbi:MAG: biotin--[acetyl-CoA-carboxylase] ligase [Planctomycetota bacterium]|nr:biotin--[acetyl-CoA-carboxylase] ligase [Planctomycetota bacterium]MDA1177786.1 biotin--[acetyl-CoA-carboxylase] ligase [Planctomycetota bacterium]